MGRGITFTIDAAMSLTILIFFSLALHTLLAYQPPQRFEDMSRKMSTYLLSLKETGKLGEIAEKIVNGQSVKRELREVLRGFTAGNGRVCVSVWGVGGECYPEPPLAPKYSAQITFHRGYYYGVIRLEIE